MILDKLMRLSEPFSHQEVPVVCTFIHSFLGVTGAMVSSHHLQILSFICLGSCARMGDLAADESMRVEDKGQFAQVAQAAKPLVPVKDTYGLWMSSSANEKFSGTLLRCGGVFGDVCVRLDKHDETALHICQAGGTDVVCMGKWNIWRSTGKGLQMQTRHHQMWWDKLPSNPEEVLEEMFMKHGPQQHDTEH